MNNPAARAGVRVLTGLPSNLAPLILSYLDLLAEPEKP
jgi:hypothetical protein